jgi:coproporphyrinogen III oxidase
MTANYLTLVKDYLLNLQADICHAFSEADGQANFLADTWTSKLGKGSTQVIQQGKVFEKGAVNFSHVSGESLPVAATAGREHVVDQPFSVVGLSLIMHPDNPFVPTTHANFRFFIAEPPGQAPIWWFGGGYDLTPYYGFEEDCRHWHQAAKAACDAYDEKLYPEFKAWCDDYFYLKHRQEPRGVGGVFFDDFNRWDFEKSFACVKAVGDSFVPAYLPIVEKRKAMSFTAEQKAFQRYRRGRYVEFNLIYDRGTLFGLRFGGRVESILCSMPPEVNWCYNWQPQSNTPEAELYEKFLVHRDWV